MQRPTRATREDILSLVNPPLMLAAAGGSLAGALVGLARVDTPAPYLLALAAALLLGAGAAFGHYFDRKADETRAPDRPLPAGRVEPRAAWQLGWTLLVTGGLLCLGGGVRSLVAGIALTLVVTLHASVTKSVWGAGFLTIGLARGATLLLGLSASQFGLARSAAAALPVLLYTLGWAILRGSRQRNAPPSAGLVALVHFAASASVFVYLSLSQFNYRFDAIPFFVAALGLTFPRFVGAVADPRRGPTLEAVQYGFLGLTLVEAALTGGYAGAGGAILVAFLCVPMFYALKRWPITLP